MPYWPHALQAMISGYRGGNKNQVVAALSAGRPVERLATEGVAINSNKPDDRQAYPSVREHILEDLKDVIKMSLNVGPTWFCDTTKAVGIVQMYGEGGTHRSQPHAAWAGSAANSVGVAFNLLADYCPAGPPIAGGKASDLRSGPVRSFAPDVVQPDQDRLPQIGILQRPDRDRSQLVYIGPGCGTTPGPNQSFQRPVDNQSQLVFSWLQPVLTNYRIVFDTASTSPHASLFGMQVWRHDTMTASTGTVMLRQRHSCRYTMTATRHHGAATTTRCHCGAARATRALLRYDGDSAPLHYDGHRVPWRYDSDTVPLRCDSDMVPLRYYGDSALLCCDSDTGPIALRRRYGPVRHGPVALRRQLGPVALNSAPLCYDGNTVPLRCDSDMAPVALQRRHWHCCATTATQAPLRYNGDSAPEPTTPTWRCSNTALWRYDTNMVPQQHGAVAPQQYGAAAVRHLMRRYDTEHGCNTVLRRYDTDVLTQQHGTDHEGS
ncbi:hypothetical protein EDB89DRAFT_1906821 [Lactarius sanguifluus]|nr:hypothetical protein EDB89DRAFT_1906821 [Lactarius sanguifluus]